MRKLKLESLHVESFVTTEAGRAGGGTVKGQQYAMSDPLDTQRCPLYSEERECTGAAYSEAPDCTRTEAMDCSFGCTMNVSCGTVCEAQPTK